MIEMLRKNLRLDKNWNTMSEHNLFLFACLLLLGLLYLGLALLYSGSARKRFALAPLVHAIWTLAAVFLSWELCLEKLFLGAPFEPLGFIGNPFGGKTLLTEIAPPLFSFFHAFFCAIATYLVMGAALERLRLKSVFMLSILWPLLVYVPVAYWVWNPLGFLAKIGAIDFAGGIVVHITSGFSALVLARKTGRRKDYFNFRPRSDQRMIFLGLAFVTFGWLGFNAGSALAWDEAAIHALKVTWMTAMAAIFSGVLIEYSHTPHRVSLSQVGLSLIAALVMITPAAGTASVPVAIILGLWAGPFMYYGHKIFHHTFKVDDGLDVFLTHALAGIIGAVVTGYLNGQTALLANIASVVVVSLYSLILTNIIIWVCKKLGADVSHHVENLDTTDHGENAFDSGI